jgi:hypothetical protein
MAEPRPETRYARQLWFYGAGDGQPIKNIPKLSEASGVHVETLRKYLPAWEKEAESLLANTSEIGLAIQLSAEKLHLHNSDMSFLREQINQVKWEMENLAEITAKLENLTEKFSDDPELLPEALQIFSLWLQGAGKQSSLRSQFLAMQKQWTSLEGIVDLKDIGVVKQKEIAKGQGKLAVKQMENDTAPTMRVVAQGVFARPERIGAGE